jgi:hypothetical protein
VVDRIRVNLACWFVATLVTGCAIDDLTVGSPDAAPGATVPRPGMTDKDASKNDAPLLRAPDANACTAAYASAVLADSPEAYYRMDERSGTVMADSTPNHLNGVYGSGVTLGQTGLVPSSSDASPHFPGLEYTANDTALVPASAKLQVTSELSAEMVFEEDAVNPGTVDDGYIDVVSYGWGLQITPTNTLELWLPTSNQNLQVVGTTSIAAGKAHDVVATYDGTTARVYLDGQLEASAMGTGSPSYAGAGGAAGLSIGASPAAPTRAVLQGKIAHVSLYSAALSGEQIQAHFHASGLDGSSDCQPSTGAIDSGLGAPDAGHDSESDAGSPGLLASPYPRLGAYPIGDPHDYYDSAFISWAAKQQVVILNIWDGWEADTGHKMAEIIQQIHAASSLSIPTIALQYTDLNDRYYTGESSSADADYADVTAMNANKWWLLTSFSSGSVVPDGDPALGFGSPIAGGPTDPAGRTYPQYIVQYTNDYLVGGGSAGLATHGNTADPEVQGFFHDSQYPLTPVDGDWLRTGNDDSAGNATDSAALRQGEVNELRIRAALNPGKYITGNLGALGESDAITTEWQGVLQGGVLENMLGETYAPETWGGFAVAMTVYSKSMALLVPPALGIFGDNHVLTNGSDPTDATPYRAMRYGLAMCLLGDAYYYASSGSSELDGSVSYASNYQPWFDEYDNAGAGLGYLGQPLSAAQYTVAWQKGVFRRDFQNGIALVNPKGNGQQTVTLEKQYRHINGTQDASTNNGQLTTSVTLADRDGLILLDP